MPLVALSVECPRCAVPFLAPHSSPANPVQCPNCGGQSTLSRCREVEPESMAQRRISTIRNEEEAAAENLEQSRGQHMKLLLGMGAVISVLGLGAYAAMTIGSNRNLKERNYQVAAEAQLQAADKLRHDAAYAVAMHALGAADWRVMLQSAREGRRALPQAEWLYQRHSYRPLHLTGYQFPQDMHVGEDDFVRLFVKAEEIESGFWIRLEETGYGWLLDWEALGRYTREHWEAFLEEHPNSIETYRVHIQRSSLPDRHFYERGFTGEGDALAVRMWSFDSLRHVHAIVDAKSPEAAVLAQGIRWDVGEGYVVRLKWPGKSKMVGGYQFVDLVEVLQPGWHISKDPAGQQASVR